MVSKKDVGALTSGGTISELSSVKSGTINIGNTLTVAGTVSVSGTLGAINAGTLGRINDVAGTIEVSGLPSSAGLGTIPTASINVLSTSVLIADGNPTKIYDAFQNLGGTPVYLAFGTPALNASGIAIYPQAGTQNTKTFYEINLMNMFRGSIYGISAGGTVPVGRVSW